ncbi:MAG TPA: UDP-3-O-(3-hydroxymyristoyl)glucosamine N-acyltransferase [Verrucomicrobiae bacterium]|nr:UDP-3-O-(3-hydroxymyristoyl)glucosamine N-acyltransferase [Verrucomicrobiae bacterium]
MKTVGELAALVGGVIDGDAALPISGVAGLSDAAPEQMSFLASPLYARAARDSRAGAILIGRDMVRPNAEAALIRVDNPSLAFARVCEEFAPRAVRFEPGICAGAHVAEGAMIGEGASIQPGAVIEPGARIGKRTVIGANCYVGHDSAIGEDCVVYPNVSIRERVTIGNRVIIHCGAVIGADGFGFDLSAAEAQKIPQIGTVRIDDRVEIGANATIDRARFGQTWVQEGAKIDNLVQVAHNVVVGKNSLIAAQVGISGSSRLGQRVILAGQAGIAGHVAIGDGAIVAAQAGVGKDVASRVTVAGYHAQPIREEQKMEAMVRRLPKLLKRLRRIEERLGLSASDE